MLRIALIKNNCVFCRKIIVPVEEINAKVPINKKIDTVDCSMWENFGMKTELIMEKIPQHTGYPHIYLDIFNVSNILTKNQFRSFLDGYMGKDEIID